MQQKFKKGIFVILNGRFFMSMCVYITHMSKNPCNVSFFYVCGVVSFLVWKIDKPNYLFDLIGILILFKLSKGEYVSD